MTRTIIISIAAFLAVGGTAQAQPIDNAIQPSPVYFGKVVSGTHPTKTLTVTNVTNHRQMLWRFDLAGAGGGKFTNTWGSATCVLGQFLSPGHHCTLVVRVKTTRPEWWTTVQTVYYGGKRHVRGQFNVTIYAHVV